MKKRKYFSLLSCVYAEVVKLANTLRSGRSGRKPLWVQVPPSAYSFAQPSSSIQSFHKRGIDYSLGNSDPRKYRKANSRGVHVVATRCYNNKQIKEENFGKI